jgi:hypothetical protein
LIPIRAPKPVERLIADFIGLSKIEELYYTIQGSAGGESLATRVLEHLAVHVRLAERDLRRIPRTVPR